MLFKIIAPHHPSPHCPHYAENLAAESEIHLPSHHFFSAEGGSVAAGAILDQDPGVHKKQQSWTCCLKASQTALYNPHWFRKLLPRHCNVFQSQNTHTLTRGHRFSFLPRLKNSPLAKKRTTARTRQTKGLFRNLVSCLAVCCIHSQHLNCHHTNSIPHSTFNWFH